MYEYFIEVKPAKPHSKTDYSNREIIEGFKRCCQEANAGGAFVRDRKTFSVYSFSENSITLSLTSKKELENPSRSLSALTHALLEDPIYDKYLRADVYNRVFYNPVVKKAVIQNNSEKLTKPDVIKTIIDMYYQVDPAEVPQDRDLRKATLEEIEHLLSEYKRKLINK